jgi:hypothetical protein
MAPFFQQLTNNRLIHLIHVPDQAVDNPPRTAISSYSSKISLAAFVKTRRKPLGMETANTL